MIRNALELDARIGFRHEHDRLPLTLFHLLHDPDEIIVVRCNRDRIDSGEIEELPNVIAEVLIHGVLEISCAHTLRAVDDPHAPLREVAKELVRCARRIRVRVEEVELTELAEGCADALHGNRIANPSKVEINVREINERRNALRAHNVAARMGIVRSRFRPRALASRRTRRFIATYMQRMWSVHKTVLIRSCELDARSRGTAKLRAARQGSVVRE
jgi:hypothetical protein